MKREQPMNGLMPTGKERPKDLSGLHGDPVFYSVLSKFTRDDTYAPRSSPTGEVEYDESIAQLAISRAGFTGSDINDYKAIMEMLPDLRRVASLLCDGILSPNDATPSPLQYRIEAADFPSKEVHAGIVDVIEDYFRNVHKIDSKLKKWLVDILFMRGSRPFCFMSESAVDDIVNPGRASVSLESLSNAIDTTYNIRPLGVIGAGIAQSHPKLEAFQPRPSQTDALRNAQRYSGGTSVSMENMALIDESSAIQCNNLFYSVEDNPYVLQLNRVREVLREQHVYNAFSSGVMRADLQNYSDEDKAKMSERELTDIAIHNRLFKPRNYQISTIKSVKTLSKLTKKTVGHGIILDLSSEAVIPVIEQGSPSHHIGYFILLDESGTPIATTGDAAGFQDLVRRSQMSPNAMSNVLNQAYLSMFGEVGMDGNSNRIVAPDQFKMMYAQVVERDLIERCRQLALGKSVIISRADDAFRMLMYRSLKQQHTRLLYVPSSLMTYMAFDYDANGIGKPLLADVRLIAALRAILTFARVNGEIKNSIAYTKLIIDLDEEDPDPEVTVEEIVTQFITMRNGGMIFGTRPADIVNQLNRAGVELEVNGSPRYDETKIRTEQFSRDRATPTQDLQDTLKEMNYAGLGGFPSELVDDSQRVDFAAEYIGKNIQLTKLVMSYQGPFCELLADYIRNFTLNSSILFKECMDVVKAAREAAIKSGKDKDAPFGEDWKGYSDAEIVVEMLDRLVTVLPAPKVATLEAQMNAFAEYRSACEEILDLWMSPDAAPTMAIGEKLTETLDAQRAMVLNRALRNYVLENNILPEVTDFFQLTDEDDIESEVMVYKEHYDTLARSLLPTARVMEVLAKRNEKVAENLQVDDGYGGSSGGSSFGSDDDFGSDSDSSGGDDIFGDFGFGDSGDGSDDSDEGDGDGSIDDFGSFRVFEF